MNILRGLYSVDVLGHDVSYLMDPDREEFLAFLEHVWDPDVLAEKWGYRPAGILPEHKNLKGVYVPPWSNGGKKYKEVLYVFDPSMVRHWQFIRAMGISDDPKDQPYTISLVMTENDCEVDIWPKFYGPKFNFKKNLEEPAKKSPLLRRVYSSPSDIHMELHHD